MVRAAANARLRSLLSPALDALVRLLHDESVKDDVKLRAIKEVFRLNSVTSTEPSRRKGRPAKALPPGEPTDVDAEIEGLIAAALGAGEPDDVGELLPGTGED